MIERGAGQEVRKNGRCSGRQQQVDLSGLPAHQNGRPIQPHQVDFAPRRDGQHRRHVELLAKCEIDSRDDTDVEITIRPQAILRAGSEQHCELERSTREGFSQPRDFTRFV